MMIVNLSLLNVKVLYVEETMRRVGMSDSEALYREQMTTRSCLSRDVNLDIFIQRMMKEIPAVKLILILSYRAYDMCNDQYCLCMLCTELWVLSSELGIYRMVNLGYVAWYKWSGESHRYVKK